MRKWNLCLILICCIATLVNIACKKEETNITPDIINVDVSNRPPIANAGLDKTIILPVNLITLDASASTVLDVEWCNNGCNYVDTPDLKIIF